jgi:hypothetical protein
MQPRTFLSPELDIEILVCNQDGPEMYTADLCGTSGWSLYAYEKKLIIKDHSSAHTISKGIEKSIVCSIVEATNLV